jgi:hypothetical protein
MVKTVKNVVKTLDTNWCSIKKLKTEILALGGSFSETIVRNTTSVRHSVNEKDILSPDLTGRKNINK